MKIGQNRLRIKIKILILIIEWRQRSHPSRLISVSAQAGRANSTIVLLQTLQPLQLLQLLQQLQPLQTLLLHCNDESEIASCANSSVVVQYWNFSTIAL